MSLGIIKSRALRDGRNYVPGEGPQPCNWMLLGEGPGRVEDQERRPFVGPTGWFLDSCARQLKIRREAVRIENVTRYLPAGKDLTQAEVDRDRPALIEAFARTQPRFVFAMGRWSAEATIGPYLRGLGFQLDRGQIMDWLNGLTFEVPSLDDPGRLMLVTVGYHPAAGLRSGSAAAKFWAAFSAFAAVCRDPEGATIWPETARWKEEDEIDIVSGLDTESKADGSPWCATMSSGYCGDMLVEAANVGKVFGYQKDDHGHYVLHNLTYDWNVLLKMGADPSRWASVRDTLPFARSLQVEPGKLKLLVQRYLGEPRVEYEDLMRPYRQAAWSKYTAKIVLAAARRSWWSIKDGEEQSLATRIKSLSSSEDPDERWADWPERYRARVTQACGEPPVVDVSTIPYEVAEKYALQDASDVRRLWPILRRKCREAGTIAVAEQDEAMIPMLANMERTGMPIDRERLRSLEVEMEAASAGLLDQIRDVAGNGDFNPASADQVAGLLFCEIGVGGRRKKTATGKDSTAAPVLDAIKAGLLAEKAKGALADSDIRALDFLSLLDDYRHLQKLLGTNIRPMWEYIDLSDRVHPRFKQGGYDDENGEPVVSGRYAMDKPNWLAFPAHSPWAKKARAVVKPPEGRVVLVVDLDQIEMREMAHQSGDKEMARVFATGEDIHARTARYVFGVKPGQERDQIAGVVGNKVTYRQAAKTLGFLLLFGGSAYGYARKMAESGLLLTEEAAEKSRQGWLKLYSGVPRFWQARAAEARQAGLVRTPLGRPRYLPHIWSTDDRQRAEAERQAGNHPIQGGAQERLKTGAIRVYQGLGRWRQRGYVEPLLTIHDELDFEVDEGIADEFGAWVVEEMTRDLAMTVKVEAKAATGPDWGLDK